MLHHLEQAWITPKEVLPEVGTALDEEFLILPVRDLAHTADQEAIPVILNEAIPIAAPDDLDDVPSRTPENGFELLNNFAVATHRAVEALQVAVDDEDQVVEALTRCERDRTQRLGFVHLAVAEKRPDSAAACGF